MTQASTPPDLLERLADLERQVKDLQRQQNPVMPNITNLADVSGTPVASGMVLEYDQVTGTWSAAELFAAGDVKWSASDIAPTGRWLDADGAAVSRSTYAALFAAIGTNFGAGNGTTTFNVPNLASRFVIGVGTDGPGATGGSRNAVTVSHAHTGPDHTHAQNVSASVGGPSVRSDYDEDAAGSAFPQGISTGSGGTGSTSTTGSSATNANLPPYIALYAYVRY